MMRMTQHSVPDTHGDGTIRLEVLKHRVNEVLSSCGSSDLDSVRKQLERNMGMVIGTLNTSQLLPIIQDFIEDYFNPLSIQPGINMLGTLGDHQPRIPPTMLIAQPIPLLDPRPSTSIDISANYTKKKKNSENSGNGADVNSHGKSGKFSQAESTQIQTFIKQYCDNNHIDPSDIFPNLRDEEEMKGKGKKYKIADPMWADLCAQIPERKKKAIQQHAARLLMRLTHNNPWTEEDRTTLKQLVEQKGKKWSVIGRMMNKMSDECKKVYERLDKVRINKGHFSKTEDAELLAAVHKLTGCSDPDEMKDRKISWVAVAAQLENKRQDLDYLRRWPMVLRNWQSGQLGDVVPAAAKAHKRKIDAISSGCGGGIGVSMGIGVGNGMGAAGMGGTGLGLGVGGGSGLGVGIGSGMGVGIGIGTGMGVGGRTGMGAGVGVVVGGGVRVGQPVGRNGNIGGMGHVGMVPLSMGPVGMGTISMGPVNLGGRGIPPVGMVGMSMGPVGSMSMGPVGSMAGMGPVGMGTISMGPVNLGGRGIPPVGMVGMSMGPVGSMSMGPVGSMAGMGNMSHVGMGGMGMISMGNIDPWGAVVHDGDSSEDESLAPSRRGAFDMPGGLGILPLPPSSSSNNNSNNTSNTNGNNSSSSSSGNNSAALKNNSSDTSASASISTKEPSSKKLGAEMNRKIIAELVESKAAHESEITWAEFDRKLGLYYGCCNHRFREMVKGLTEREKAVAFPEKLVILKTKFEADSNFRKKRVRATDKFNQ